MRAEIAAYDAARAAEAEAARLAYIAPIKAIVETDSFKAAYREAKSIYSTYEADGNISIHLDCFTVGARNLAFSVGVDLDLEPVPAPEPEDDEEA